MKIQIASDLHLTLLDSRFPGYRAIEPTDADVLVLAGDIHRGAGTIETFADWPVPVVYVHGNHELYHEAYSPALEAMRAASAGSNVHLLERDALILHGVRFLGCCLWTDYRLFPGQRDEAMATAEKLLRDHQAIRMPDRLFAAQDALGVHQQSRAWLEEKLGEDFDGPTVVVTHHGPHPKSVHPRYAGMLLNAAFVSDLTPVLKQADLWIHGHVHDSFDYRVSGTRVIANPRGYAMNRLVATSPEEIIWENERFDPRLVVDITRAAAGA